MAKLPKEESAPKAKKAQVAKKVHFDADGGEHRSALPGETKLEFQFATGETLSVTRDMLSDDMWYVAGWHGIAQKLGDTYADAKKKGLIAYDEAEKMLEQISNGNWVRESQSTGPRIGLLVEAIVATLTAAGKDADPIAIAEKCKGDAGKAYREGAKARPDVAAHYARIESERAAARAAAKAEAAKGVEVASVDEL